MTAYGTRARHRDQANEWIAYTMVVLIAILLGSLAERVYDHKFNIDRSLPPQLVAALEAEKSGGRPEVNPVTNTPRGPDDVKREKELKSAIARNPKDLESLKALAAYYYDTLQADAAIEIYQQILTESPDDVAMMTDMAAMQFVQGEVAMAQGVLPKDMDDNMGPVAAVATLMEATEVDHTYAPALQMLGWAYTQIGQRQKAIEAYEHALEHVTDEGSRHMLEQLLAGLTEDASAPAGAPGSETEINPLTGGPILPRDEIREEGLLEMLETHPNSAETHLQLGHYYYDTFQPEAAVRHYEQYIEMSKTEDPGVHTDYATVMSEIDLPRAISMLEQVTKDHPEFVPGWNNLGFLRKKAGNDAAALEALYEAWRHAPEAQRTPIEQIITGWGGTIPTS